MRVIRKNGLTALAQLEAQWEAYIRIRLYDLVLLRGVADPTKHQVWLIS